MAGWERRGRGRLAKQLWWAAAVAGLDQAAKAWALAVVDRPIAVLPFLDLVLVRNPGAAFAFLAEAGGWQRWVLVGVAVVIGVFIVAWMRRVPRGARLVPTALALVLGGAVGNLLDRVFRGAVIDFVDLHYGRYHWPAFNVADAAITVGFVILVLVSFRASAFTGGQR